jgi:hypothetical protein
MPTPAYKKFVFFGLLALVLANSAQLIHRHWPLGLSENAADFAMGLGFGLAFALLISAMIVRNRSSRCA